MNTMIIELNSPFDVGNTVERIVAEAERESWKVPAIHDLQQTLAKSGRAVNPVKVIELCKPDLAVKILELNDERSFSVFMPCRISVYAMEDGSTRVSVMDASMMMPFLPEKVSEVMVMASRGSSEIVQKALALQR